MTNRLRKNEDGIVIETVKSTLSPEQAKALGELFGIDCNLITGILISGTSVEIIRGYWEEEPND